MSWLDSVPTCDSAYVFQAAFLCEDCAAQIISELEAAGKEDTGDSDDFPQGPYSGGGGEADSPNHCDGNERCVNKVQIPGGKPIGCPLANDLTSDGEAYVIGAIAKDILTSDAHGRHVGRLWMKIYNPRVGELIRLSQGGPLPHRLTLALNPLFRNRLVERWLLDLYTDLNYLYGATATKDGEIPLLWRLEIDDDGDFVDLQTVELPPTAFPGRDSESAIEDAWKEGAWD